MPPIPRTAPTFKPSAWFNASLSTFACAQSSQGASDLHSKQVHSFLAAFRSLEAGARGKGGAVESWELLLIVYKESDCDGGAAILA